MARASAEEAKRPLILENARLATVRRVAHGGGRPIEVAMLLMVSHSSSFPFEVSGLQFFQAREGANYALQMAGATFAVIPTVILFTFTQKYFVQGIATSGIKG